MGGNKKQFLQKKEDFSYKRIIYDKKLPEKWNRLYRYRYAKLREYYLKVKKQSNPLYDIILEKIAFISVYTLYVEAGDFKEFPIDNPLYISDYATIIDKLLMVLNKLLQYTEVKITASKSFELPEATADEITNLTDEELNARAVELISKAKGRIKVTTSGTKA